MGIQGLLPLLKSIEKPIHLKDCAGQTLAVDGYVWLHKGAFACAQELCLGQTTQKYVTYFMRKIDMLKFFGIKPYVVFDGGYLPSKAATEQDRRGRREESKKLAMDLHKAAKSREALEQFRKCVDVTPEMAFAVIQALKAAQVDFVVAPYEADAQLAYLEKKGLVDGIITEDSDLLVFGCQRVIFKLDQYGAGIEILQQNFGRVRDVSLHDWTMTEIRHMCILAGCDYLPSIPGMGLKTAQRLLRRFKSFERAIKHHRIESVGVKIPVDYEDAFRKADLTFLYSRVYDPVSKSMVHLNPVPEELEELVQTNEYDFLGPALEEDLLYGIVTGYVNPIDKTPLDVPKTTSLGTGDKENRPSARKNCHSVQPSSRSLYTYFSKSTAPSPRSTVETGEHVQKREPLKDAGAQPKMRVVEKSHTTETTPLSDALVPQDSSSACQEQLSSTAKTVCAVTVEARSRYFKVEASTPSEAIQSRSLKRSYPAPERGDSGIGLDEAYLLHTSYAGGHLSNEDALYLGPATERSKHLSEPVSTRSSSFQPAARTSSDEEQALEFKKAEAKVIQGWREKFSNPSGIGIGQTTGLTRAGQANRSSSKHTGRPKTTSAVPGHRRQGMLGIVRTTPSYPSHSLSTAKPRTETHSMSGPPVSQCGSDASQDVPEAAPCLLNLERFKYTPSASASSASTSSTAGGGGGGGGA